MQLDPTAPTTPRGAGIGGPFSAAVAPLGRSLGAASRWATAGALAAYLVATLADGDNFRFVASLTFVKLVVLGSAVAAIVDAFKPTIIAAALAQVGTVFLLGNGVLGLLGDTWWGSGAIQLLLVAADVALVVGFLGFLGRSAAERRVSSFTPVFEIALLALGGLVVVLALVMYRDALTEQVAIRLAGSWLVAAGTIVTAFLTRSVAGLVTGGAGAVVHALALLSDFYDYSGAEKHLLMVVLLGLAGLAGYQLLQLRNAPLDPAPSGTDTGAAQPAPTSAGQPVIPPAGTTDYASFGARFGATIVDGIILSLPQLLAYGLLVGAVASESGGLAVLALLAYFGLSLAVVIAYCRRTARTGQSWGYSAVGIYLVGRTTGRPISAWAVFGRGLARGISALPCYLGFFWMLWDPERQTWHDKIVGTVVVRSMAPVATGADGLATSPAVAPPPAPVAPQPLTAPVASIAPVAPVPTPAPPMFAGPATDIDDRTVPRPSRGPTLSVSDGRTVVLDSLLLVGRDPTPAPGDPPAGTLAVAGDLMVSKTHLEIGSDDSGAWVRDRNSTNGVVVRRDGFPLSVPSDRRLPLSTGDRIEFGDHWIDLHDE